MIEIPENKKLICVDEAGWTALAGPIIACAVHVPHTLWEELVTLGVKDSKQIRNPEELERLHKAITSHKSIAWAVTKVDPRSIDQLTPDDALHLAMRTAVFTICRDNGWEPSDCVVIVDGSRKIHGLTGVQCIALPKADAILTPASTASVLAKQRHDEIMQQYHERYPLYGWATNHGYATEQHMKTLHRYGPVRDMHRDYKLKDRYLKWYYRTHRTRGKQMSAPLAKWLNTKPWSIWT